jgi:hypothetical protein
MSTETYLSSTPPVLSEVDTCPRRLPGDPSAGPQRDTTARLCCDDEASHCLGNET